MPQFKPPSAEALGYESTKDLCFDLTQDFGWGMSPSVNTLETTAKGMSTAFN